jgi:hypothetical protein
MQANELLILNLQEVRLRSTETLNFSSSRSRRATATELLLNLPKRENFRVTKVGLKAALQKHFKL